MDNLENILSEHRNENFQFSDNFTDSVMTSIQSLNLKDTIVVKMWQKRIWQVAAACFVACLVSLYALDGSLSVDSMLGLSEYNDIELSQTYQTYESWEIE